MEDRPYVLAWRQVCREAKDLVTELGKYFDVRLLDDVCGRRTPEEWSEAEILRYRRDGEHGRRIGDYAILIGARYIDAGNPPPAGKLPIPYPEWLSAEDDRENFRASFFFGTIFGSWARPGQLEDELARLEAELGIRK